METPIDHDLPHDHISTGATGGWLRETPFWAVSAILHATLFAVLLNVVMSSPPREARADPLVIVTKPLPPPPPPRKRDVVPIPEIPNPRVVENPVIERVVEEIEPDIPKGIEPEKPDALLMNPIGFGPSLVGPGDDLGGRPDRIPGTGGPADDAVRAALDWLRRHQHADGGWRARDFILSCANPAKPCRNVDDGLGAPTDGRGFEEHDIGATALAMLAFAGYGHTHRDGRHPEYVAVLKRAVKYLKRVQVRSRNPQTNGRFGHTGSSMDELPEQWIYDHAIATMAMAELLAMSADELGLKRSVRDAVELCLHARNPGWGWKYGIKPGRNDSSVTGWMVLALKTAKNARLDIPRARFDDALQGALKWFDRATSVSNGKTGYQAPGDEGSRLAKHPLARAGEYPFSKQLSCMTAVGVLCRLFAGERRSSAIVKKGVDILMRERPTWQTSSKINFYYWYYGSYALFQFGGSLWDRWNTDMLAALLKSQRVGGGEDGSWDPIGEWGPAGGRVYSTALGAMTLEVYYRYLRAK